MIAYASTGRVRASAVRKIEEEAGAIRRRWWRGALGLESDREEGPAVLSGETALFRGRGVPDVDDLFMAFADAAFILLTLEDWSRRFTIKWHVRMNGEDWVAIDPTGLSGPLLGQMEKWARRAGIEPRSQGTWAIPAERQEALFRQYSAG